MGSEWAAMILGVDTKKLLHFRRLKRLLKLVGKNIESIVMTPSTSLCTLLGQGNESWGSLSTFTTIEVRGVGG